MTRRLALLLAVVFGASASAQTDRFATTAAELSAAISASQPGDSVTMADGTWTNTNIVFDRDGLPGDSITLRAQTPGEVLLTASSSLSIAGDYLKVDGLRFEGGARSDGSFVIQFRRNSSDLANHSRLTNCTVVDYNPAGDATEYKWVSIYGQFNRVDHCYFAGKTHEGALMVVWFQGLGTDDAPSHRIDRNHFGPRPPLGRNGAETIRIGTSTFSMRDGDMVVEENLFEETNGETEAISNKSGNNLYRANTFRRVDGTLTLRHGNACIIDGNFFLGEGLSGTGGVRIIGEDHVVVNNHFQDLEGTGYSAALSMVQGVPNSPLNRYFQVKRPLVANNTFVNVEEPFLIGVGFSDDQSLPAEDITIANNVVQTVLSSRVMDFELDPVGTTTYAGNVVFGQPNTFPATGFTFANPMLVADAEGIFRPSSGSPVLGAATPAFAPMLDMDGQPRAADPDSGADELSAAPATRGPLDVNDVGPAWRIPVASESAPPRNTVALLPPTPNPFLDSTAIAFTLERAAQNARVRVLDLTGRVVTTLVSGGLAAGPHTVRFDGRGLAAGAYVVLLEADGRTDRRLVTLARSAR